MGASVPKSSPGLFIENSADLMINDDQCCISSKEEDPGLLLSTDAPVMTADGF